MSEQRSMIEPFDKDADDLDEFEPGQTPQLFSRRSVLRMGVGVLSVLALLEVGGASTLYLQSNAVTGRLGGLVTAGLVDDFGFGSVTEFPRFGFFLVRSSDGGFLAVDNRCTHLGCAVSWSPEDGSFLCPCHAAVFDFYGTNQGPPVPRPLDLFAVEINDGEIRVDTARKLRRETFDPIQLVYAEVL